MRYILPALAVFYGSTALGVLQGFLWAALAPGVQYQVFDNQSWAPLPTETLHIFTAFAIFSVMGLFVGGGIAATSWMFRSLRGVVMLMVCGISATAGSAVAGRIGVAWARGTEPASVAATAGVQKIVLAPAVLTGWPAYLAGPAAAVIVYTFLVAWNGLPNLGRGRL